MAGLRLEKGRKTPTEKHPLCKALNKGKNRENAGALQEFCNRWCKREHVESNALNSWKLNIFKIIDGRISFYCNNLDLLPPKPKFTFRHLKKGIQEFHRKFVFAPAAKAANNVVVV